MLRTARALPLCGAVARACARRMLGNEARAKNPRLQSSAGGGSGRSMRWLIVIPLTTFALGTWQVKRYYWKQDLLNSIDVRLKADPVELGSPSADEVAGRLQYVRVWAEGEYLPAREIFVQPRMRDGKAGVHVITPFMRTDGSVILVSRGWMPKQMAAEQRSPQAVPEGRVRISGILRAGDRETLFSPANDLARGMWYWIDLPVMARILGALPLLVDLDAASGTAYEVGRDGSRSLRYPVGGHTVVSVPNNHAYYIATWYGMSAATLALWLSRVMR